MRKSRFIRGLEGKQSHFVVRHDLINSRECFPVFYLKYPILCRMQQLASDDEQDYLQFVSAKLGVSLSMEEEKNIQYIKVRFHGKYGFFCYAKFYRCLDNMVLKRLNSEFAEILICGAWKKKLTPYEYDLNKIRQRRGKIV